MKGTHGSPNLKPSAGRVNYRDLSPEQKQKVLQAMQNLRRRIGNAILRANPGLGKSH